MPTIPRRLALLFCSLCLIVLTTLVLTKTGHSFIHHYTLTNPSTTEHETAFVSSSTRLDGSSDDDVASTQQQDSTLSIMPPLLNETAKAELGRHAWYLLHTVLARFPENPRPSDRADLESYVTYFIKLYPCRDCALHFQREILAHHPVQTSGRVPAAMWGCTVHNLVNKRLKKAVYDCSKILDDYDCGCGDGEPTEEG